MTTRAEALLGRKHFVAALTLTMDLHIFRHVPTFHVVGP